MIKVTFTLDEETVSYLDRVSERLAKAKSQVVREAIKLYGEQMGRLSDDERDRMLAVLDDVVTAIPDRPREEVEAELEEIQRARSAGGRRSRVDRPSTAP